MVGITVSKPERLNPSFIHKWFESIDLVQLSNVSTVPSITGSRLKRTPIPLPSLPEQRAIAPMLEGVGKAIGQASIEKTTLTSLKVTAADALLTGRVRVGNWEGLLGGS